MLIHTLGLFWKEEDVFWGAGSQAGMLLGVPAGGRTQEPVDFRMQTGIYVLYADYEIVYVGQAGVRNQKLMQRLKQHRKDDLAGRWNRFSWFGTRKILRGGKLSSEREQAHAKTSAVLNHIEGILIHAVEPPLNRQGGKFGRDVHRYLQVRDKRLGLTDSELLKMIHEKL
jgi:hypothetical protein